jgi:PAS domain S-box-containing protein
VRPPRRRGSLLGAGLVRLALPALVTLLSIGGYLTTSMTIRNDRNTAAGRRAEVESVRTQAVLDRARASVVGLANVLADEPVQQQQRFTQLAGSTVGSIGLVDSMWVNSVADADRTTYEHLIGGPILRRTSSGTFEPSPVRPSYLVAIFTSRTRQELRQGVDVSDWPVIGPAISNGGSLLAVTASDTTSLGGEPGFYLLEASRFGSDQSGQGFLAVFVPRGWLTVALGNDPRRIAIRLDGGQLDGALDAAPAASGSFETLAKPWRIEVGTEPATGLQSLLPWFALGWPIAAALIAFLVGRGIVRRRRAERAAERIFDLSVDLLGVAGLDGYFKRVNPAFERTLGYSSAELLSRPLVDFVHPQDRQRTTEAIDALRRGEKLVRFENRQVCADGSERCLQWSARLVPAEGLVYVAGGDVTERRRAEDELRRAQKLIEASRDESQVLANEQSALRRVATLVANGAAPEQIFAAVGEEVSRVLGADDAVIIRLDPDGTATVVAVVGDHPEEMSVGSHWSLDWGLAGKALRTGRTVRDDGFSDVFDKFAESIRRRGIRSAAATPIVVEGHLWGSLAIGSRIGRLPPDTEQRIVDFTKLIGTAIANAESSGQLIASRARVVAAADETRRRIERDLHDGTQQRLVSLALTLRSVGTKVPPELDEVRAQLGEAESALSGAIKDLQETSRGIHPGILSKGGLGPALSSLARRAGVPVELQVGDYGRLPDQVEVAAYYIVSEGLTNAAKHAQASLIQVELTVNDETLQVTVRDNGVGSAQPGRGSGLIGLRDRVEALGGTIEIRSAVGRGTSLVANIPISQTPH